MNGRVFGATAVSGFLKRPLGKGLARVLHFLCFVVIFVTGIVMISFLFSERSLEVGRSYCQV